MADYAKENRKYVFQKRLQEAVTAWGFLLPNLIGFLLITFFPIFATFYLAFTEWDGKSFASPAQVRVAFRRTDEGGQGAISIPANTRLSITTRRQTFNSVQMPITYRLLQDVVISGEDRAVSVVDMVALLRWSFHTNQKGQLLEVVTDKLPPEAEGLREGDLFFSREDIRAMNIRWVTPVEGVSIDLDLTRRGREIVVIGGGREDMVVPAGTLFLADMYKRIPEAPQDREWFFETAEPVTIADGRVETVTRPLTATENGHMGSEASLALAQLRMQPEVPGVEAYIKFVGAVGSSGLQFVGLRNFRDILFRDIRFRDYLVNTFIFLFQIPFGMMVSLILALAMNLPLKGIVAFRVMYFLPVISNIVAVALVWRWFLNPDHGIINEMLRAIGIVDPPNWLGDRMWARVSIILVDVWKGAGFNMMLYLAGLQAISHDFYEAAEIDGATPWQQFWSITWPLLSPTNFFILVMGLIGGFQAFGTQFAMTGGGPAGATTTIVYYVYNNAFAWGNMGYAAAVAVLLFGLVMVATLMNWVFTEKSVEY